MQTQHKIQLINLSLHKCVHTSTLPYILPGQDHLHLLPGGVCGHLLIDKVLQLLMQACHEVCTWRVEGKKDWDKQMNLHVPTQIHE